MFPQQNSDRVTELLEKQSAILEILARQQTGNGGNGANGQGLHQKTVANFSTYTPLHGPGGIWGLNGLERDVVSAHVRPFGLAGRLPMIPTVFTHPLFGILSGYSATSGSQPDNACGDAPAGYVKGCTLTAELGRFRMDTNTIDMDDVMLRLHRGDFTDLMLRGRVLGLTQNLVPGNIQEGDILNVVSASEMVIAGVNVERELSRQIWQGTPGVSNQFAGLDRQIATGQVDAVTNQACPAADSDVKDFAYDLVGGSGRDIVEYLSMLEFYLRYNAMTMGLDPVQWVIVMRPELWFELTAVWPCLYNTHRCGSANLGANSTVFIDGRENISERDAMRNGMYLDVNGNRYEVVLDTGIYEHTNINDANVPVGTYASSIYFVPLTITGGMPVTYREYLDYRQAARDIAFAQGKLPVFWTDNGVYSWALSWEKWCYKFSLKTEQRVILRTPHLAGRIDHVRYSPLQHVRSAYPDDPYYVNGGVSLRANVPSYNAVWMA